MKTYVSDIAFSPAVKDVQERLGSRNSYRRMEDGHGWASTITPDLEAFIAERDSFYLATASADRQPYIQHRGGQPGFLRVLDETTLAFGDFGGNRQYISIGNLSENNKVSLFLMDYPNRRRVKIWGRAKVIENDEVLMAELSQGVQSGKPERAFLIEVEAWDANCPQHITPRFSELEIKSQVQKYRQRIDELEAEVKNLKQAAAGDEVSMSDST
jgi:hypothetical protein